MVRKDQIQYFIRSLEALPTLPSVAGAVMKIALRHDRPKEELLRSMELDQSFTIRILKAANASLYGRQGAVTNLQDAIKTIGLPPLRSIVLSSTVMDVFEDRLGHYGVDPVNLWIHSLSTAVHAQELSKHLSDLDPQEAFIAGLIHDIGKILLCISLEEDYPKIVSMAGNDQIALHKAEMRYLGYDHAEVGKWLLEQWNIPRMYGDAISQHHHPVEAVFSHERHFRLSCIVAIANHFSYMHTMGSGGDPDKASLSPTIYSKVRLPKEIIEQAAMEMPLQVKKLTRMVELKPTSLSTYHSLLKQANRELGEISQHREFTHYALIQKEKELRGINAIGLSLLGCTTTESAVKLIAEGLVKPFSFSRTLCTVYHHDHWEYHADAFLEGEEWVCHTFLRKRSHQEDTIPEPGGEEPWLHVDLIGKNGLLGYLKIKPGSQSVVPLEKLGLLLASYAKLVSEALERIQAYQKIQGLTEDLSRAIARLDKEKEIVEYEKSQKEAIFTSLPIGLILLDKQGSIEFHNPEAEKLLRPDKPLADRKIQEVFGDPELPRGMAATLEGIQVPLREFSAPSVDPLIMKTIRWFLIPIRKGNRTVHQLLLVMQDITEEKELQRQIVQSARMASIGELAAGTAHNLRSPLGAVKGILELLLEEIDSGRMQIFLTQDKEKHTTNAVKDQLEVVIRSLGKCFSVIDDLLEYSRIKDHTPEILRLRELLEGTEALIGELFMDRKIQIEKDIQSDTLFGRKADLIQVFLNLYSNAYKAMPQGGILKIKSQPYTLPKASRPYTEILVIDTGHGIAPEFLPRIFDPFFTTSVRAEGAGLGLSLAHKIVKDHEGSIDVESRVGQGTTFILRLPAAPDTSATERV